MPIFITQGRYSEHALKGMMANPEDRAKAVGELFQRAGGKLLGFYFTSGSTTGSRSPTCRTIARTWPW